MSSDNLVKTPTWSFVPDEGQGDFNATVDHAVFRSVLRLGYADADGKPGNALVATWGPVGKLALITIDHVLVDQRCAVRASSVHAVPDSSRP